ncbi:MAG: lamin tail domain-containing protein [Salinivirgaceae bacterium]
MRKITLIFYVFALLFAQGAWAQDLFFSEYIEGGSNNKAIEIYNPTSADVDLTPYVVKLASNGADWGNTLDLTGTLAAGDVYVIYNSQSVAAVAAVGDIESNVTFFNGDDALGLFKSDALIDIIGNPTVDPGSAWDVAGTTGATQNHTLVRKSAVTQGNVDWTAASGTDAASSEWEVYNQDDFSYLGWHITPPSNEAEILGFVLAEEISTAIISSENAMVTSTVAWDADLGSLEPTITVSAGAQVTATTLPVVFNGVDPVIYRVTAADATEKLWTVYVLQAAEPEMLTIKQIQETADASGDSPYNGEIVRTKGVVVTVDAKGFYLQDGAGAWNGVYVYENATPTVATGDSVSIEAKVYEYSGLTELIEPTIVKINSGNTVADATVATLTQMNGEMYEAVLVTIENVTCTVPESSKNWTVADADGNTLVIRNGIVDYAAVLDEEFVSITGFGQQYNTTYQLFPRSLADIITVGIEEELFGNVAVFPNPFNNVITVNGLANAKQIRVSNILGQEVMKVNLAGQESKDISTDNLNRGVYFVTITDGNNNAKTVKVVKQ